MDNFRASKNKFEVNTTFTGTGNIGASSSTPYDVRGHNTLRVAVEGVGGGNVIKVYGRIRHQTNWTLLDTITGTSDGVTISCSVADEVYFNCDTYAASGVPALIASGFFLSGGSSNAASISGTPSAGQVAVWDTASSIAGSSVASIASSTLSIDGYLSVASPVADSYVAVFKGSTTTCITRLKVSNSSGSKYFAAAADFSTPGSEYWNFGSHAANNMVLGVSGQIFGNGLGTSSLPKFSFYADPDTGIYSSGADKLNLVAGASDLVQVDGGANSVTLGLGAGTTAIVVGGVYIQSVAASSTTDFGYIRSVATASQTFSGGSSVSNGGFVKAYGGSHATKASYVEIGSAGTAAITVNTTSVALALKATISHSSGDSLTLLKPATGGPSLKFDSSGASNDFVLDIATSGTLFRLLNTSSTAVFTVNQSGKATIGASGGTQFHAVNGRGFDITYGNGGVTAFLQLTHTQNVASSGAALYLQVAGGSAGDAYASFVVSGGGSWTIGTENANGDRFVISAGTALSSSRVGQFDSTGTVVIGKTNITTSATDGFVYIPAAAGTPTGTPTSWTSFVPLYFDTSGVKLWIYTGGSWKGVVVS